MWRRGYIPCLGVFVLGFFLTAAASFFLYRHYTPVAVLSPENASLEAGEAYSGSWSRRHVTLWTLIIGGLLTGAVTIYFWKMARHTEALTQEITTRKKIEIQKDLLLREVNHRVKNSLQLVISLLGMQCRQAADETVRQGLKEAVSRIQAVARVHERLYLGQEVSKVNMADYLQALCADLQASAPEYVFKLDARPVQLTTDWAVHVGLIFAEIATNAVKHARAKSGQWNVDVFFGPRDVLGELELSIRDYGQGLPEGFTLDGVDKSLGMRVITGIAHQISGDITVTRMDPGTKWTLVFKP